jgi:glutamate N-acetyltransferase/amino-acid N-acetyltransferase
VRLGVAEAAIKKPGRKDLLLIELAPGSRVAGVFTRNAFCAAPVQLCRERLAAGSAMRAMLVNSGNANAATGSGGLDDARATTAAVAQALGCEPAQVLPFSTGVIGQRLPVQRMLDAVPRAAADLRADAWQDAARAIMTTDTIPKGASRQARTAQGMVTVTGIAKGVGMIYPDMATLLSYIATDARLTPEAVKECLRRAVEVSFNSVTVDGDTSTNDSCVLLATAQAGHEDIGPQHPDFAPVCEAVTAVCVELAQAIARDGEGATRFITIEVGGARSVEEARQVGYSIAHSPLVKTAMFAGDANWGRIVMAIGKAGVEPAWRGGGAGRGAADRARRAASRVPRGTGRGGGGQAGVQHPCEPGPRRGAGAAVDLRLQLRLRQDQRRVPHLSGPARATARCGTPPSSGP